MWTLEEAVAHRLSEREAAEAAAKAREQADFEARVHLERTAASDFREWVREHLQISLLGVNVFAQETIDGTYRILIELPNGGQMWPSLDFDYSHDDRFGPCVPSAYAPALRWISRINPKRGRVSFDTFLDAACDAMRDESTS